MNWFVRNVWCPLFHGRYRHMVDPMLTDGWYWICDKCKNRGGKYDGWIEGW